jgi:hypothetical protein
VARSAAVRPKVDRTVLRRVAVLLAQRPSSFCRRSCAKPRSRRRSPRSNPCDWHAQRSGPPPSPAGRFFARTSPRPSQCPANLPEQAVDLARARSRVPHAADFLGERPSEILAEVFGRSTRGVENRYSRAACIFSYSPRCSRGMERRPLARRRAGPLSAFQHDVDAAVRDARVARSGFADPYLAERRTIEPVLR